MQWSITAAPSIPQITVVVPFRDAAATLAEALASIAEQTFADFDCVLVDNDSRDASREIAHAACAHDRRFRLLHVSGTLVQALNAGIRAAQAPFIARMDADDLAHPQRLERQLAALTADPSLSIVSCLVSCFPAEHLRDGMRRYEAWLNAQRTPAEIRNALFVESPVAHPSVVISKRALGSVGSYRETGGPEDYDLWMRLLTTGHRAAKVEEILLHWRDAPDRLTRSDPRYRRERFFETKLRYFPSIVPAGSALQIWGAGPIGRRWGRALMQRGYVIRRFIDIDPRKIGRSVRGTPVEPPERLVPGDGFILAAVGSPGAREKIEAHLRALGLRPWDNYLAVA